MMDQSDRGAKIVYFAALFLIFSFAAFSAHAQSRESWIYDKSEANNEQAIVKWCSKDGTRIAYSMSQPKDFTQCGKLETAIYCDPSGNKYIGPGKPPYAYQDCSVGPRIQVVRTIPASDYKTTTQFDRENSWKPSSQASKSNGQSSYFHMLDGLLGGLSNLEPNSLPPQKIQHKDERPTHGPFAPSYLKDQSPPVQQDSDAALKHALDQILDDQ